MALSLNPLQLLEFVTTRADERDERMTAFLQGVADNALAIAQMWDEATKKLLDGSLDASDAKEIRGRVRVLKYGDDMNFNRLPVSRLEEFHILVSDGLRGLSSRDQQFVVHRIEALLVGRDLTKCKVENLLSDEESLVFCDPSNSVEDLRDLRASVTALYREAAALDALAKAYRVRSQVAR